MKPTHLIQVLILLAVSIRFTMAHNLSSAKSSALLTETITMASTISDYPRLVTKIDEIADWLITDDESQWTPDEAENLRRVLQNTFAALESHSIDGKALLDGYRFRHDSGRYVDDVEGRIAKIDHNVGEITLSDTAFVAQQGFFIFHELGHAVDYRLDRGLSAGFHRHTGGQEISENGDPWRTAENYWLRLKGRDDREEAAADAFALWVMVNHAGLKRPIFAHQPLTTDYDGISAAITLALQPYELHTVENIQQ